MKLRELIERLQEIEADLREGLGDDCEPEIVVAYQEHYPLTGELLGAAVLEDDDDSDARLLGGQPIVWLAVGGHVDQLSPYAPRVVFTDARS